MKKINITGEIVKNDSKEVYQFFGRESTCPNDIKEILNISKDNEELEIYINSIGGEVISGFEIYSLLKEWKGKTTVKIIGMAGSSASTIAMSGDIVKISPVGQVMVHNSAILTSGNHNELSKDIETLKSIDQSIVNAYKLKTGLSNDELKTLMNNETYMTAQKAKELGFIDVIMFDESNIITNNISSVNETLSIEVINKTKEIIAKGKELKNIENNNVSIAKAKAMSYLSTMEI